MVDAKDIVKEGNVLNAYKEGKYICFDVCSKRNAWGTVWTVKMDPNTVPMRVGEAKI